MKLHSWLLFKGPRVMYEEGLLDNQEMIQAFPYFCVESNFYLESKMKMRLPEYGIDNNDWCIVGNSYVVAKDQETLLNIKLVYE